MFSLTWVSCIVLCCIALGVSWSDYFMYIPEVWCLWWSAFFYILNLSSPDLQVEILCLELCCFVCVI